eukprot:CAMPEP_0196654578 /NCGR_PEP_ID=MMETSP1086-20130531/4306_1 /TAXON_ID=77921 /ORGANISM="Cyanoptyche  gloeocystis , Strain SAG4.97" /LENGTH=260 /DNA_ID=CAMNT_0041986429 /DNA_START=129 /DNA_END=911 /DNA_ORIENTATION=-
MSYGLASFFRVPEQGMQEFDVLSRSSGFLVQARAGLQYDYHFLGTAHVTHPFLFPDFYTPQEYPWLQFVNERHTLNKLQIREDSGGLLAEFTLQRKSYVHAGGLDLVILHMADEHEFLKVTKELEVPVNVLQFSPEDSPPDEDVSIHGHRLTTLESGQEVLIPFISSGKVNVVFPDRGFAKTPTLLEMGMCGGPLTRQKDGKVIGMLEAAVTSTTNPDELTEEQAKFAESIRENAVYVPSLILKEFVSSVEDQMVMHEIF